MGNSGKGPIPFRRPPAMSREACWAVVLLPEGSWRKGSAFAHCCVSGCGVGIGKDGGGARTTCPVAMA